MLIQKFESFVNGLHSCEMRFLDIKSSSQKLYDEIDPKCPEILQKCDEVEQAWEELKELTHARQEALTGAKQVHVFDRNADETITWIQEKEAVLSSEDYGHDLESIQIMIRKHDGFEVRVSRCLRPTHTLRGGEVLLLFLIFSRSLANVEVSGTKVSGTVNICIADGSD